MPVPASPKHAPPKPKRFAHHALPPTRKVMAPDDFGSFGKMTIEQYLGAVKKLKGTSNVLPVLHEMGIEIVADLAYANVQHVSAAMKLRAPEAAKKLPAALAVIEAAVTEARAGLRKLLNPFKQKLFDKQKL